METFFHFSSRRDWQPCCRRQPCDVAGPALAPSKPKAYNQPQDAPTTYRPRCKLRPPSSSFTQVLAAGPPPSSLSYAGSLTLPPVPSPQHPIPISCILSVGELLCHYIPGLTDQVHPHVLSWSVRWCLEESSTRNVVSGWLHSWS